MAGTESKLEAGELHALADLLTTLTPSRDGVDLLDQLRGPASASSPLLLRRRRSWPSPPSPMPRTTKQWPLPIDVRRRGVSIGAEVALATLASPYAGEQRVVLSRRLRDDLPLALAALQRGELTEDRAFVIAREVAHLDPEQRRRVDHDLGPQLPGSATCGSPGRSPIMPVHRRRGGDPSLPPRPRRPPRGEPPPRRRHRAARRHASARRPRNRARSARRRCGEGAGRDGDDRAGRAGPRRHPRGPRHRDRSRHGSHPGARRPSS